MNDITEDMILTDPAVRRYLLDMEAYKQDTALCREALRADERGQVAPVRGRRSECKNFCTYLVRRPARKMNPRKGQVVEVQ